ncbi:MAG TPA: response regulator transcription factor [Candidatus Angelobacter sp.]|nr:response regulator transcription factor [Candidatus Angelobacter sp.]
MSRILVVEDEAHIAAGLRFNLEAEGHQVEIAGQGEDALERLLRKHEQFDLLVLDVMLPGQDGFAVARELRRAGLFIPLLMLTARGRPEDVLKGFECGADDYLPKPFNLDILVARIASLLRRRNWMQMQPAGTHAEESGAVKPSAAIALEPFRFNGKLFDMQHLQLQNRDETVQLTLMEAELLAYLIRNSGRPVSRKEILEQVWGLHEDTDTRAIDNFIVRLRRYIEDDSAKPRHLLTIRGLGYQFVPEPKG